VPITITQQDFLVEASKLTEMPTPTTITESDEAERISRRNASDITPLNSPRSYKVSTKPRALTENDTTSRSLSGQDLPRHWIKEVISRGLSRVPSTKRPATLTMRPTRSSRRRSDQLPSLQGRSSHRPEWSISEQDFPSNPKSALRPDTFRQYSKEDPFEPFTKVVRDL
jgi:hypothetical protein